MVLDSPKMKVVCLIAFRLSFWEIFARRLICVGYISCMRNSDTEKNSVTKIKFPKTIYAPEVAVNRRE